MACESVKRSFKAEGILSLFQQYFTAEAGSGWFNGAGLLCMSQENDAEIKIEIPGHAIRILLKML